MTMVSDLSDCPIYEIKLNPAPKWTRYPSKIEAARLKAKEAVHVEKVWLQRDNKVEPGSSFIYFSKLPPGMCYLSSKNIFITNIGQNFGL